MMSSRHVSGDSLLHHLYLRGLDSRYLERCIEAFRSTLRQFAMRDLREYAELGCEVEGVSK